MICVFTVKPDICEIFRTFSRYLEMQSGISVNIFRRFFVIFLSTPIPESGENQRVCSRQQVVIL